MTGLFLGGALAPAGMAISFLRSGFDRAAETLVDWRRALGQQLVGSEAMLTGSVAALEPFQSPWTRELLFDCGTWTAYLNNNLRGGDPSAAAPYLSRALDVDLFVAVHTPLHATGHGSTQLRVIGPGGDPPLMYRRTIAAYAEDGRWSWREKGDPFPFGNQAGYLTRRVQDRFDRSVLVEYLSAVGIRADEADFYGRGTCIAQVVDHRTRDLTASEVRHALGL